MGWKEKKSIERIFNTFKRLKNNIYQQDIDALKNIKETIEENEKNVLFGNMLYAKLLCQAIKYNIIYYQDINIAIKETGLQLEQPLSVNLDWLVLVLNDIDLQKLSKLTDEELKNKLLNQWKREDVEKSFLRTANDFLKDIEKYK